MNQQEGLSKAPRTTGVGRSVDSIREQAPAGRCEARDTGLGVSETDVASIDRAQAQRGRVSRHLARVPMTELVP